MEDFAILSLLFQQKRIEGYKSMFFAICQEMVYILYFIRISMCSVTYLLLADADVTSY